MTNTYAKIENGIVTNLILCSDSEISYQNGFHVKVTEDTNNPIIGCEYIQEKNKFKLPKPYDSWQLNEESMVWEPPVEKPVGATIWNESDQSWIIP